MEEKEYYEQLVGTLFDDRYRIEKLIGIGGMAIVYKATDTESSKVVALKILKDEFAGDEEAVTHFMNEAKAISLLSHPNIIGIYDISTESDSKYLVMEYADGISLRTYMDKRGVLSFDEIERYTEQILAALDHAHSKGVIHRDIKPQNIMLLKNGIVKVTDFGIAKLEDNGMTVPEDNTMGTVNYISPEQAEGGNSDCRSDIYSLGVMMYEMATGKLPFYSDKSAELLLMHMQDDPVPPRRLNRRVSLGLEQMILCAMEKNPAKRYQSALDMFRELRRLNIHRRSYVLSPAQIKRKKRSETNRVQNRPSKSVTPVILGVAFALLVVGIVSVFTALDRMEIGTLGSASMTVPNVVGQTYVSEEDCGGSEQYAAMLENLGLGADYVVSVEYKYSTMVAENVIISQTPNAGSSRKKPCSISLTVSCGLEMVAVEDCTAMTWTKAQIMLRSQGFIVNILKEDNAVFPAGYVIASDPLPGTVIKKGETVTLRVSNGISVGKMNMPNLTLQHEVEVKSLAEAYKLLIGNVTYTRSDCAPGTVLFHFPEAGDTVYAGVTYVDFIVSGGPDFGINYYPDITSKDLKEATEAMQRLGFEVVAREVQSDEAVGTVLEQIPAVGAVTEKTKKVYLDYSIGSGKAELIEMIGVIGRKEVIARAMLEDALIDKTELDISVVYRRSDAPVGTIIAQNPEEGDNVMVDGSIIYIILDVSAGPNYHVTITAPDVIGLTETDALAELTVAGFTVEKDIIADENEAGTVIYQSVNGGTNVYGPEGDIHIRITVSGGPDYVDPATTTEETTLPETPESSELTTGPEDSTSPEVSTGSPEETTSPEVTSGPEPETSSPEVTSAPPEVTNAPDETTPGI